VVSDLDRALVFYRDILGFQVEYIIEADEKFYGYPAFGIDPDRRVRFATLNTASQERVMALTEVSGDLPEPPMPRCSAIVVEIPELDDVLEASREAGLTVLPEDRLVTTDGREGKEAAIIDADGNLVVIYNITGQV